MIAYSINILTKKYETKQKTRNEIKKTKTSNNK